MKRLLCLCALLALALAAPAWADDIRVDQQWLAKSMESPETVIIDVRQPYHWKASPDKIKGARRLDPGKVKNWARWLAKDKTYILYCA